MSIQAVAAVLRLGPEVSGANRLVLIALANHASEGGECWPSIGRIASEAGCHEVTAKTSLRWLITEGYVERIVQGAPDDRIPPNKKPNLYRLTSLVGGANGSPQAFQGVANGSLGGSDSLPQGVANGSPKSSLNHQEPRRRSGKPVDKGSFFAPGSGRIEPFQQLPVAPVDRPTIDAILSDTRHRLRDRSDARSTNDEVEQ